MLAQILAEGDSLCEAHDLGNTPKPTYRTPGGVDVFVEPDGIGFGMSRFTLPPLGA